VSDGAARDRSASPHEPDPAIAGDRRLVDRCLAGDESAHARLVRDLSPLVWLLCRRAGLARAEAEDVAQDAFCCAVAALPRYRGQSRLSTWFCTVVLRRIVDYRRAPARKYESTMAESRCESPAIEIEASEPSPESGAIDAQRRDRVRAALDSLREPDRSVLSAYYLAEMPVAEIARVLAIPEGTVKTHLHRGRRALRDRLSDLC
jgi:RNA polymerase sigma-70 factor (ECF subfamily)